MDFKHFWVKCALDGLEYGHGLFWHMETAVTITGLSIGVVWKILRRRRKAGRRAKLSHARGAKDHELPKDHWWHEWENVIMLAAIGVALLLFLTVTIFVAPFRQYHEEFEANDGLSRAIGTASNEIYVTKADLKKAESDLRESEEARLRQLEKGQPE